MHVIKAFICFSFRYINSWRFCLKSPDSWNSRNSWTSKLFLEKPFSGKYIKWAHISALNKKWTPLAKLLCFQISPHIHQATILQQRKGHYSIKLKSSSLSLRQAIWSSRSLWGASKLKPNRRLEALHYLKCWSLNLCQGRQIGCTHPVSHADRKHKVKLTIYDCTHLFKIDNM